MLKLKATEREALGKKVAKHRLDGKIPGVVYGAQTAARPIFVNRVDFKKIFKAAGESSLITLELEGQAVETLIHETQFAPVSGEPIHADFYVVRQDQKIEVDVPLIFFGVASAVKELGGSLVKVLHELPISALPKNLPHNIEVDISSLTALDSQILIKDLILPAGVRSTLDPDETVALIAEATEEEIEPAAPVDLSEIEVGKKGKKEEAEIESEA